MIKGTITSNVKLAEQAKQFDSGMKNLILKLTFKLLAKVKNNLSGVVLNVRTGTLRRSTNAEFTQDGKKGTVGTNLTYGAVHELGLDLQIREHMRTMRQIFGKPLDSPIQVVVRQHFRKNPERSFLRSALETMGPEIKQELNELAKSVTQS